MYNPEPRPRLLIFKFDRNKENPDNLELSNIDEDRQSLRI